MKKLIMFLFTIIQFSCYSGWEKYELDEITTIKNYSWSSDTTNIKFNNSTGTEIIIENN